MMQVKIRTVTIGALFVAVCFALITPAILSTGANRGSVWLLTILYVPIGMAALSAIVLRSGPHRDAITGSFLVILYFAIAAALAAALCVGWVPEKVVGTWKEPLNLILLYLVTCGFWWMLIAYVKTYLLPTRCPCCQKRGLLRSVVKLIGGELKRERGESESAYRERERAHRKTLLFSFYRCGVCDAEAFLSISREREVCPSCGRQTMLRSFRTKEGARRKFFLYKYRFFWCLACGRGPSRFCPGSGNRLRARVMIRSTGSGSAGIG